MTEIQSALAVREKGMGQLLTGNTFQAMMKQSLPAVGLTPERLTRVVLTEFRKVPALTKCTPASFYGAVMQCAQLGMMPGGAMGLCWILPYGKEATFVLGYKGALHLCWQTDMLNSVDTKTVFEGDAFEYRYGSDPYLHHQPVSDEEDPGKMVAHWATIKVKGADTGMFHVMTNREMLAFRSKYVRKSSHSPWFETGEGNGYGWMARKTVLKQLLKLGPVSTEFASASAADDRASIGLSPDIGLSEQELLTQLASEGSDADRKAWEAQEEASKANETPQTPQENGPIGEEEAKAIREQEKLEAAQARLEEKRKNK